MDQPLLKMTNSLRSTVWLENIQQCMSLAIFLGDISHQLHAFRSHKYKNPEGDMERWICEYFITLKCLIVQLKYLRSKTKLEYRESNRILLYYRKANGYRLWCSAIMNIVIIVINGIQHKKMQNLPGALAYDATNAAGLFNLPCMFKKFINLI